MKVFCCGTVCRCLDKIHRTPGGLFMCTAFSAFILIAIFLSGSLWSQVSALWMDIHRSPAGRWMSEVAVASFGSASHPPKPLSNRPHSFPWPITKNFSCQYFVGTFLALQKCALLTIVKDSQGSVVWLSKKTRKDAIAMLKLSKKEFGLNTLSTITLKNFTL